MFAIYSNLRRFCLLMFLLSSLVLAQANNPAPAAATSDSSDLSQQVIELRSLVQKLQARVDELERRSQAQPGASIAPPADSPSQPTNAAPQQQAQAQTTITQTPSPTASSGPDFLHGTTFNLLIDGYYGYNFNDPIGRVNLLRAYDISSNAFSLNQAALVIESAADPDNGKRFGLRLDLQYGQATETLQGNPSNEPRPDIYRNIFQAYGTYVFPIGKGLTVDFGKFASSLGIEGNYTKDQINYSRSYLFDFLPFYHMGVRATYKFNDKLAFNYWIVNGTQQTEPFNGFKDEFFGFTITPNKNITWNVNYYLGQEHADVIFFPNGGAPLNLPTEQGVAFEPILNPPAGKLHIFDTYVSWQTMPKLTFALEADDELERLYTYSAPSHTDGGAVYLRYQLTPKVALAGRAEYLSDRGGLFTGVTQALKEGTFTTEYKFADGFLARGEWRRDFSNQPYFLTDMLGILKKDQATATLGLVWWVGGKQGSW
jgi:hypothetical protein